jgi:hypothetical protein
MDLIYRQGRLFKINDNMLPETARKMDVKNKLFIALFREFQGASVNDKYKSLSIQDRIAKLNQFAQEWLTIQGYK